MLSCHHWTQKCWHCKAVMVTAQRATNASVDGYFDLFVRQTGLSGWQISVSFFVSVLNAVRCTTPPQTVQQSANGWPNAQMIQRRPTTSARTLKMYERHNLMATFTLLLLSRAVCACGLKARISIQTDYNTTLSSLVWIEVSISAIFVVTTTSLQICDGCAAL